MIKKIVLLFSLVSFVTIFNSCEEYDPTVSAPESLSFNRSSETFGFTASENVYPLRVTATKVSGSDRVVDIVVLTGDDVNGNPYTTALPDDFTVALSVLIPAGELSGSTDITFDPSEVLIGDTRKVTFEIVNQEGYVLNSTTSKFALTYAQVCFSNTINLDIVTDSYGSETTWEITDGSGSVVESGGPYADVSGGQTIPTTTYTLPDGDYTFTVYDSYGDGMSTSATIQGSYAIAKDCGTVLVTGGGDFGASSSHVFSLP